MQHWSNLWGDGKAENFPTKIAIIKCDKNISMLPQSKIVRLPK
jgi:hypothetical protein